MSVLRWIWDNRQWLFSGVGVAVIGILIAAWPWYFSRHQAVSNDGERNQAELTRSVTRQPDEPKVYLREQSPNEVAAHINSLKPLERELIANQTYIGRWVRWRGTILDINPYRSFLQEGAFTVKVGDYIYARAYALLEFLSTEKHLVEPLQEGDLISYEGKIIAAFSTQVSLTHVTYSRLEERSVVDVTPEYLMRLFEGHTDIQASTGVANFIGKWMKVSGPLGNILSTFSQVTFADHAPISMFFRKKKWVDRLSILSRGDNITVLGQITYIERDNLVLDNCELIDSW